MPNMEAGMSSISSEARGLNNFANLDKRRMLCWKHEINLGLLVNTKHSPK